mgnify:FL=1
MINLSGWLGLLLLFTTLIPFILRRLQLAWPGRLFFSSNHHALALVCLALLTLHGFWALTGGRGWGWGGRAHFAQSTLSGVLAWLALLAVIMPALAADKQKPFPRTHCWVALGLGLLVLNHVF